jgi:hypothetical protein
VYLENELIHYYPNCDFSLIACLRGIRKLNRVSKVLSLYNQPSVDVVRMFAIHYLPKRLNRADMMEPVSKYIQHPFELVSSLLSGSDFLHPCYSRRFSIPRRTSLMCPLLSPCVIPHLCLHFVIWQCYCCDPKARVFAL